MGAGIEGTGLDEKPPKQRVMCERTGPYQSLQKGRGLSKEA